MSTNTILNGLQWADSCSPGTTQWCEVEAPDGRWLRIMKRALGGYRVTIFGADKRLAMPEAEMSADEVAALLA